MQTATVLDFRPPANEGSAEDPSLDDIVGQDAGYWAKMPELPRPRQRWAVRKATVNEAVRGGWVPIGEVARGQRSRHRGDVFLTARMTSSTIFRSMSSWPGSATSTGSAFTGCAPRAFRYIVIPKWEGGRSDLDHARMIQNLALTIWRARGLPPSGNSTLRLLRYTGPAIPALRHRLWR
jgi:hypothetical protein